MKRLLYLPFLFAFLSLAAQQAPPPVVIQQVMWLDVAAGTYQTGDVLLQDGKISAVGKDIAVPDLALPIDGSGKYLVPGLVDAHIHLFQSGGLYTRPDAIDLRRYRPYEVERKWCRDNAPDILRRYLRAGVTTVVDMGGPFSNFDIRAACASQTGFPNLWLTGPLISTYQPEAFQIPDPPIVKVPDVDSATALVDRELLRRPDFIKIWYIAESEEDARKNYDLVASVIRHVHKRDLRVAVHATELYTARLAVKAGADVLVHSIDDPIPQDFIETLRKKDIAYIPTLVVHGNYIKAFSQSRSFSDADFAISSPEPLGSLLDPQHLRFDPLLLAYQEYALGQVSKLARLDSIRLDNLGRLNAAGVTIATGTDAGNIGTLHASSYFEELAWMERSGMSRADILKASTLNGARVLGRQASQGSIAVGMRADLLLLNSDPLADLAALQDIAAVFKDGHQHPVEGILDNSPAQLAQQQLNAYNCGDVEAFLAPYSEEVELFNFPEEAIGKGKEGMRASYGRMFRNAPDLHCELVQRDVLGNTVIDHERITGLPGLKPFEAVAIYKVEDGKIAKVYFLRD